MVEFVEGMRQCLEGSILFSIDSIHEMTVTTESGSPVFQLLQTVMGGKELPTHLRTLDSRGSPLPSLESW
jgi:hypothetical protein